MKRYGRLSRLSGLSRLGLAALVVGVVAVSFLATHASAVQIPPDWCTSANCGEATCVLDSDYAWDLAKCVCNDDLVFDKDHRTCVEPKCDRDCGHDATCIVLADGTFGCSCVNKEFTLCEADKTCFGPLLQTVVQLPKSREKLTFPTSAPPQQLTGTTTCRNVSASIGGNAKVTVMWDANLGAAGIGMCKRLTFYSKAGCKGHPGLMITRPAKKGRSSYPVTKRSINATESLRSIGCKITTCHKDCGAAECVVKEGQQQCQCPKGLVFNAAMKLCRAAPPPKCKPACTENAQCMLEGGKSVCRCKKGFKMVNSKCTKSSS